MHRDSDWHKCLWSAGYQYSFDSLAQTVLTFTEALRLQSYAQYVFSYGAPTGFRLAMAHPERVRAIISQNGNAYEEGLGPYNVTGGNLRLRIGKRYAKYSAPR